MKGTMNPGKQRKMLFNAPAHIRHKLMAAPLSAELLAQKGAKALPVKKGDTVRIMRGDHKGFEGKVSRVDLKHYRVYLEGLTREKVDGTTVFVALHPSKIMIRTLNLNDKVRKAVLDRKKPIIRKGEKPAKKTAAPKKTAETKPAEEIAPEAPKETVATEEITEEQPETEAKKPAAKQKIAPATAEGGT